MSFSWSLAAIFPKIHDFSWLCEPFLICGAEFEPEREVATFSHFGDDLSLNSIQPGGGGGGGAESAHADFNLRELPWY